MRYKINISNGCLQTLWYIYFISYGEPYKLEAVGYACGFELMAELFQKVKREAVGYACGFELMAELFQKAKREAVGYACGFELMAKLLETNKTVCPATCNTWKNSFAEEKETSYFHMTSLLPFRKNICYKCNTLSFISCVLP